jgi:hypothetical protein
MKGRLTTCPKSGILFMSSELSWGIAKGSLAILSNLYLNVQQYKESSMNLSLLQRPKKIKPGTKTMYVYHPSVVTTSATLEPGVILKILDVFEGDTTSETTLKVMTAEAWQSHLWGRGVAGCTKEYDADNPDCFCDCEKELSEMSDAFKENVHYVLLSDVGK